MSFWVYPTTLNPESYLVHAFERIGIVATSGTNKVLFKFKDSATTELPISYTSPTSNVILLNSWNYISASMMEILSGN